MLACLLTHPPLILLTRLAFTSTTTQRNATQRNATHQGIDAELLRALLPRDGEVERRDLQGFENENFPLAVVQSLARELEMPHLQEDVRLLKSPPLNSRPRPVYLSTALQVRLCCGCARDCSRRQR